MRIERLWFPCQTCNRVAIFAVTRSVKDPLNQDATAEVRTYHCEEHTPIAAARLWESMK